MSEFFFVLKTALFAALLLMVLQMKVGGMTLERRTEGWIYQSRLGGEMQAVARGAVRAGYEGVSWIRNQSEAASAASDSAQETHRERSLRSRSRSNDLD